MRRFFSRILTILMVFLLSISCYAIGIEESTVSPRYTHINTNNVSIAIDEDTGIAQCSAYCYTVGEYTVEVVCKLQKYTGAYWATLKTWYASGTRYARASGERAVDSGYTYRVYVTFSVRDSAGNLLESDTSTQSYVYPAQ